jgi:hypothetical protein
LIVETCDPFFYQDTNTMAAQAITKVDLQDKLTRIASGKVRDLFTIDDDTLLFVASDRISAFDVVMKNVRTQSQPNGFESRTSCGANFNAAIISFGLPVDSIGMNDANLHDRAYPSRVHFSQQ